MTTSPILRTAARALTPVIVGFSLYLLWRGHNEPGGGFVGGLVAAAGLVLHGLTSGVRAMRRLLRVEPRSLAATGVLVALAAGVLGLLAGRPFLTGLWTQPGGLLLGTPLLFDLGVYLVVVGAAVGLFDALAAPDDETDGEADPAAAADRRGEDRP